MNDVADRPVATIYQTDTGFRLASTEWPRTLVVADQIIRAHSYAILNWPYLILQVENGRAVYRVETKDQGAWRGILVESSLCPQ